MFKLLKKKKAQSTLEYAVLIIIVIGALIAIQSYVKRGIQGRLRQAADDIGDQYEAGNREMTRRTVFYSKKKETDMAGIKNSILEGAESTNVTFNEDVVSSMTGSGYWPGDPDK